MRIPRLRASALLLFLITVILGCGDDDSPEQVGPDEPCLSSVTLERESLPFQLEVAAVTPEGCAQLEGPLAAFNWFSFADPDSYLTYGAAISQILADRGTKILATGERRATIEAPSGVPSSGGAYVHEELAIPLYPSASGFMDMVASPEFQEIIPLQQRGARQEDYIFGFQRCIVGCESRTTAVATDDVPLLLHIFRFEGEDLENAILLLARAAEAPEMVYGGKLIARFRTVVGGVNVNTQNAPWGEGTVVFRVESEAAARSWIASEVFRTFRDDTSEDVLVLLGSGLIGDLE